MLFKIELLSTITMAEAHQETDTFDVESLSLTNVNDEETQNPSYYVCVVEYNNNLLCCGVETNTQIVGIYKEEDNPEAKYDGFKLLLSEHGYCKNLVEDISSFTYDLTIPLHQKLNSLLLNCNFRRFKDKDYSRSWEERLFESYDDIVRTFYDINGGFEGMKSYIVGKRNGNDFTCDIYFEKHTVK